MKRKHELLRELGDKTSSDSENEDFESEDSGRSCKRQKTIHALFSKTESTELLLQLVVGMYRLFANNVNCARLKTAMETDSSIDPNEKIKDLIKRGNIVHENFIKEALSLIVKGVELNEIFYREFDFLNKSHEKPPVNEEESPALEESFDRMFFIEKAKFFIQQGADVNSVFKGQGPLNGKSVLRIVVETAAGDFEDPAWPQLAIYLVEQNADINAMCIEGKDKGTTALFPAIQNSPLPDLDVSKDRDGELDEDFNLACYLIEKGANVNIVLPSESQYAEVSPLWLAARRLEGFQDFEPKHGKLMDLLIQGSNLDAINSISEGESVFSYIARSAGIEETCNEEHPEDPSHEFADEQWSWFKKLLEKKEFLEKDASSNVISVLQASARSCPLLWAMKSDRCDIALLLVKKGVDVDVIWNEGGRFKNLSTLALCSANKSHEAAALFSYIATIVAAKSFPSVDDLFKHQEAQLSEKQCAIIWKIEKNRKILRLCENESHEKKPGLTSLYLKQKGIIASAKEIIANYVDVFMFECWADPEEVGLSSLTNPDLLKKARCDFLIPHGFSELPVELKYHISLFWLKSEIQDRLNVNDSKLAQMASEKIGAFLLESTRNGFFNERFKVQKKTLERYLGRCHGVLIYYRIFKEFRFDFQNDGSESFINRSFKKNRNKIWHYENKPKFMHYLYQKFQMTRTFTLEERQKISDKAKEVAAENRKNTSPSNGNSPCSISYDDFEKIVSIVS